MDEFEPARKQGAPEGTVNNPSGANQYRKLVDEVESAGVQGGEDKVDNININQNPKKKRKGGTDPEYVIARLKRDKDDPEHPDREKAGFLLAGIERGEIKPYKAAKAMGYVKAPDPVAIVEKQREKLEPDEQVRIWEEWGRALPDEAVDRVEIAKEAYRNLTPDEVLTFMEWANNQAWSSAA